MSDTHTAQALSRAQELPPIDPNVVIPRKVRAAAAAANAHYGQPPPAEPAPVTPPQPAAPVQAQPAPQPATPPAPVQATPAPAPVQPAPPPPPAQDVSPEQWEHRYNSMKGRFDQASHTVGVQSEQLRQMGDELMRIQAVIANLPQNRPQPPEPPKPLVTDSDVQTYGPELIDMIKRGAKEAVAPELSQVQRENAQLRQRLQATSRQGIYATLDHDLPEWKAINTNPRFLQWLSLRDIYSGEVRRTMLTRAMQAADAPRVLAFFKGFVTDEQATGQQGTVPAEGQQPQAPARVAAVPLETLAAPGRANPATGGTQVPTEKPVFTRTQVAHFYDLVRRGAYVGREAQKEADEKAYIDAAREGRVRG